MTTEETYMRLIGNSWYTNTLGKVMEASNGRFCKFKLISATAEDLNLPIIQVPIGRLIGTSSPVVAGMILPLYFSKWAMNEIIIANENNENKCALEEMQFTRNNAYAIPILFDDMLKDEFPEEIRFHEKPIFEKGATFKENSEFEKNVEITQDLKVNDIIANDIKANSVDVASGISKGSVPYNHP